MAKETSELRFKLHKLVKEGVKVGVALGQLLPGDTNRSKKLKRWEERGLWPVPPEELGITTKSETSHTEAKPAPVVAPEVESDQLHTGVMPQQGTPESGHTQKAEISHTTITSGYTEDENGYTEPESVSITTGITESITPGQQPQEPVSESLSPTSDQLHTSQNTEQHVGLPAHEPGYTHGAVMSHTEIETLINTTVRREMNQLLKGVELVPVQRTGRGGGSHMVKKAFSLPADVWEQVEAMGGIMSNHVTAALRIYLNLKKEKSIEE